MHWPGTQPTVYGEITVSLLSEFSYPEWIEREFFLECEVMMILSFSFFDWYSIFEGFCAIYSGQWTICLDEQTIFFVINVESHWAGTLLLDLTGYATWPGILPLKTYSLFLTKYRTRVSKSVPYTSKTIHFWLFSNFYVTGYAFSEQFVVDSIRVWPPFRPYEGNI